MRRLLALILTAALLLPCVLADSAQVEDVRVLPGQKTEIRYYLPETGPASLVLTDGQGNPLRQILPERNLLGGSHILGKTMLVPRLTATAMPILARNTTGSNQEEHMSSRITVTRPTAAMMI